MVRFSYLRPIFVQIANSPLTSKEVGMRLLGFAATIAALTVCALAFTASDAFAAEVVPIQGKYSKVKLDGICAANGGQSYGNTSAYGCTKGKNTVECDGKGNCTGYIGLQVQTGKDTTGILGAVLQFSQ
jgi:hypothetical protein